MMRGLRSALAALAPPAARALYYMWRDPRFASFAAAEAAARSYEEGRLVAFRRDRAKLNAHHLTTETMPPSFALLLLAAHMSQARPTRVVDFGGGFAEAGLLLKRVTGHEIRYFSIDTPAVVEAATSDSFFDWADYATALPASADVFYSGATIQYLEDPYAFVALAFERTRETVIFARNNFYDGEYYRVQKSRLVDNGIGPSTPEGYRLDETASYATRAISRQRIVDLATRAGWEVFLASDSKQGELPYLGVRGGDLVFRRSDGAS